MEMKNDGLFELEIPPLGISASPGRRRRSSKYLFFIIFCKIFPRVEELEAQLHNSPVMLRGDFIPFDTKRSSNGFWVTIFKVL